MCNYFMSQRPFHHLFKVWLISKVEGVPLYKHDVPK